MNGKLDSAYSHHAACRMQQRGIDPEWVELLLSSFGGMISVRLKGDDAFARRVIKRSQLFTLAESLGGVESLISQPFSMTHASIPLEQRLKTGITPQLLRLSVGIEDAEDLIADLQQALAE